MHLMVAWPDGGGYILRLRVAGSWRWRVLAPVMDPMTNELQVDQNQRNMLWFQTWNAANFPIIMGVPLVLLAHFIGAREGLIGLLLALPPAMLGLQLIGARAAERIGYRRMMVNGWRARSWVALLLVPVPLLVGRVSPFWLQVVLVAVMLVFTALRGFASSAWVPWVKWLIPAAVRGRYFGQELQTAWRGELFMVIACGIFLGAAAAAWRYAVLFALATVAGLLSAHYLAALPEPPLVRPTGGQRTGGLLPFDGIATAWRERGFRRVVRYAAINELFSATVPGFLVVFLKEVAGLTPMLVLFIGACATAGAMVLSGAIGRWTDRFGSRPFMRFSGLLRLLALGYWMVVALGWLPFDPIWAGAVYVLMGAAMALNAVPMARLALGACPPTEVAVGWAFLQVVVAIMSGTAPLVCGLLLQALSGVTAVPSYALLFGAAGLAAVAGQVLLTRIPEPEAVSASSVMWRLIMHWPARMLSGGA